jgi:hypothetical protein
MAVRWISKNADWGTLSRRTDTMRLRLLLLEDRDFGQTREDRSGRRDL